MATEAELEALKILVKQQKEKTRKAGLTSAQRRKEDFVEEAEKRIQAKRDAKQAAEDYATLQVELRGEEKARSEKEQMHRNARRVWLGEGGTNADFDAIWDQMYLDLLYQKTLTKVTAGQSGSVGFTQKL